jgi:integrase
VKLARLDQSGVVRYLSGGEENRLRKALDDRATYADHLKPIVLLALNTGMRRGELFSLAWESVDMGQASLAVTGSTAKSGKTRHIPLNAEALAVLKSWHKHTDGAGLIFKSHTGERFDNIKKSFATTLRAANIQNFRFHDTRHSFASKLVMAGVDLNTVRELLGHADIKMTLRYAHLAPEHKAAAVAKLVAK